MTDRAHFHSVVQDGQGNIQPQSQIRVLQNGTTTPVTVPLYPDNTTATPMSNPFITPDGNVDFYLTIPSRVALGITIPGQIEVIFNDVDVNTESSGATIDQTHAGAGTNSTSVGASAVSAGTGAAAFGNSSSASGNESSAFGHNALASGLESVAVGSSAASGNSGGIAIGYQSDSTGIDAISVGLSSAAAGANSVAVGDNTVTSQPHSTAIGSGASTSTFAHSTALGAGAISSEANQVRAGTSSDFLDIPGGFHTVTSHNGTKWRVYVRDDGQILSAYHFPVGAANLLTGDDATFETSTGGWTIANGAFSSSATFFYSGTHSLRVVQSAAGTTVTSPHVAATPGTGYVGRIHPFLHAGDGSGTAFTASLLFYDSTPALIGSANLGPVVSVVDDIWLLANALVTAPVGTATVALQLAITGGVNLDVWYSDDAGIFAVS